MANAVNVKKKRTLIKKIEIAFGLVVVAALVLFLALCGLQKYEDWKFNRELVRIQAEEDRPYLEDTYGGKTPKETLELFITAVEKGDYDLASKYFILSKQEEWSSGLVKIKEKNNINFIISKLKGVYNEMDNSDPTEGLNGQKLFTVGSDVPVTFIKYPQGNWKIEDI